MSTANLQMVHVLEEAKSLVTGDRQESYGSPQQNFTKLANLWSAYLGYKITPQEAAVMMMLLKISRVSNNPTEDTFVDMAGYSAIAAVVGDGL